VSDRYGDVDDLDEALGELEEDESSAQDEPDPDAVLNRRKIFTDKSDPKVGSLYQDEQAGDIGPWQKLVVTLARL
jgi:hypothetical protein